MGGGSSKSTSSNVTNTTTVNKTFTDSFNTTLNRVNNTSVAIGDLTKTIPGFAAANAGPKIFAIVAAAGVALVLALRFTR